MTKLIANSNELSLSNYHLLRFGEVKKTSHGDFLDNIDPRMNLSIAEAISSDDCIGDEYLIIFNEFSQYHVYKNKALFEVIKKVIKGLNISLEYPASVIAGLACSAFSHDLDGVIDNAPIYEDNFFESSDSNNVQEYRESFFCVASLTEQVNVRFNLKTLTVTHEGKLLADLGDLYGRVNEDASWVVGVMR